MGHWFFLGGGSGIVEVDEMLRVVDYLHQDSLEQQIRSGTYCRRIELSSPNYWNSIVTVFFTGRCAQKKMVVCHGEVAQGGWWVLKKLRK